MQSLCDKVNLLLLNVNFIEYAKISKSECMKLVKTSKNEKDSLVKKLKTARQLLEKYKTLFHKLQEAEKEVQNQISILNRIELLPENICDEVSLDHSNVDISNGSYSPNSYNISPSCEVVQRNKTKVTPNYLTFEIPPLTIDEYELIPKYMLCRLTLESINSFIDHVNSSLLSKYNLLSKPVKTLKKSELKLYKEFKIQQTGDLKVKRFITESDIAREYNKRVLEKRCNNFLTILRHCKRISRVQISGKLLYLSLIL